MKKYIIILLSLLTTTIVTAKEEVISKTYDANTIHLISIENRYGEIKVETWKKPVIAVDVIVKVSSNKQETIDNIVNNVGVNFSQEDDVLNVKTEFGNFFSFLKMSNDLFRGGAFSINYTVRAPEDTELKLDLKSGNIILYERKGSVSINQTDGYTSSQALHGDVSFVLRGCHVKVESAANLHLDMKSGSIELQRANAVQSDTYNSEIKIRSVGAFEGKSLKDSLTIGKAEKVILTGSISHVNIHKISDLGAIAVNYGSAKVQKVAEGFHELKLTGRGSELFVNTGKTPMNVAISHHQTTDMHIPDAMGLRMKFGESQKDFITTGVLGVPAGNNQLLINCRGGSLTLQ